MMQTIMLLAAINMTTVVVAGLMVLALGLLFAIVLNAAYAKLKVEQDPTVEAVEGVLPGVNCGGCGLAGCSSYAKAIVADHGLLGKCGPGGEALVHKIAAILGIEADTSAPTRAVVHCSAKGDDRIDAASYFGLRSCAEAQLVAGVTGCPYGCMAMGDCVAACDFDAIHIVDGLAVVDYEKCVGCGACVTACPRGIISLEVFQEDPMLVVACRSLDKAKDVRGYCKVGCIGCSLCAKMAPGMFSIENSLAVIDYEQYGDRAARDKAVDKCPRSLLVYCGTKPLDVAVGVSDAEQALGSDVLSGGQD